MRRTTLNSRTSTPTVQRRLAPSLVVATLLLVAAGAQAQAGTHDLARRLVSEGIEAAQSNDWETARLQFQKAYDIKPVPQTLYNLAAAQEKTLLLVEADRSYRLYLRETEVGGNAKFRKLANDRREELVRRIAHVTINVDNLGPDDVLLVNDREVSNAIIGESIPVNPGWTKVMLRRADADAAGKNVELSEGASQVIALTAPKYVAPTITAPTTTNTAKASSNEGGGGTAAAVASSPRSGESESEAEEEGGGGLLLPVAVGGGILVVAAIVAAGAGAAAALLLIPGEPTSTSLEPITVNGL